MVSFTPTGCDNARFKEEDFAPFYADSFNENNVVLPYFHKVLERT